MVSGEKWARQGFSPTSEMLSQLRSAECPPGVHICGVFLAALWSMITGKMAAWENCLRMKKLKWNINKKLGFFFLLFFSPFSGRWATCPPAWSPARCSPPEWWGGRGGGPHSSQRPSKWLFTTSTQHQLVLCRLSRSQRREGENLDTR